MNEHNRPVELGDGEELAALLADEDVVLLEFYTSGCGACGSMEAVLGVVAKQTDATVATLNPGNDISLVDASDVRSVPALLLFVDGEEVDRRMEGFVGADELLDMIMEHAPDSVPSHAATSAA